MCLIGHMLSFFVREPQYACAVVYIPRSRPNVEYSLTCDEIIDTLPNDGAPVDAVVTI
jgi:hypothetical protein